MLRSNAMIQSISSHLIFFELQGVSSGVAGFVSLIFRSVISAGHPQFGHAFAYSENSFPHSEHLISAI